MYSLNYEFYTFNLNLHFSGNLISMPCLVMFKRKLWFNVIPGKDMTADLTFHFPQVKRNTPCVLTVLLMLEMLNDRDTSGLVCAGNAQVPAGRPRLQQRGHGYSGRAAVQSRCGLRSVPVCHDP